MPYGIGIDLGGTQIKAAAFDLGTGERLAALTEPTRDGEAEGGLPAWAAGARRAFAALRERCGGGLAAAGVSAPGLASADGRCIDFMPGRLAGLERFAWGEHLGIPALRVLNDAHAALLGEVWLGAAKGCADAFMLTLGTGVGGAAVCGGRLLRGAIGRAGHLGHIALDFQGEGDICGTPGSLEDMIGECSLPRRSGGRFAATADLVAAAASGDAEAAEIWARSVRALAAGIASLINVLDPEAVVIGGGIAAAGDALFAPLRQHLAQFEWRPAGRTVPLRAAQLGDWAGCAGAVRFAASRPEIG